MNGETISVIASAVVAVVAVGSLAYIYFREIANLRERISSLETKIEPFWELVRQHLPDLMAKHSPKGSSPNPQGQSRREELLYKLKTGIITRSEAAELEGVLSQELEEAKAQRDFAAILGFLLLLGLIATILSKE